jgi:hypothetical protein
LSETFLIFGDPALALKVPLPADRRDWRPKAG